MLVKSFIFSLKYTLMTCNIFFFIYTYKNRGQTRSRVTWRNRSRIMSTHNIQSSIFFASPALVISRPRTWSIQLSKMSPTRPERYRKLGMESRLPDLALSRYKRGKINARARKGTTGKEFYISWRNKTWDEHIYHSFFLLLFKRGEFYVSN